jgi:hypothetical protein
MSLISKAITHLFGGVSQQASALRDPSQCEAMENCWPDVAQGVGKRPPAVHIAKLSTDTTTSCKVHLINRDGGEQYAVIIKNGDIKVYDTLTGATKTVTAPDGMTYLATASPLSDIAAITVADTTFIVNKSKVVGLDAAAAAGPAANTVHYVHVKTTVINTVYRVVLPGLTAQYNSHATDPDSTTTISGALAGTIDAHADYVAVVIGSVIKITRADNAAFACSTQDGFGDQALYHFSDSVNTASELPPSFWADTVLKVSGSMSGVKDDYYVKYDGTAGVWKEAVKQGLQNSLTATTMPHKLVRNADGTFTFSKIVWASREVGDADSCPAPSFVGRGINSVVFFRDRLVFLSAESIVMSRVADYYTFWNTTASTQLDDDPIDVTVADAKVSYLYHAMPFQDSLLLFSDTTQYQLVAGDVLTASTVRLEPTTRFSASKVLPPTAAGRNVFFAVNKGGYSSIREYFVAPGDVAYSDAADVTAHVPTYVPEAIRCMEASSLTDALFAVSSTVGKELYVYKFLWDGDKKVQSSWGKWVLDVGATVISAGFTDATLNLIVVRSDGTYVEKVNLQSHGTDVGMDRTVYLDRRTFLLGSYNSTTKLTTWTLPFADAGEFQVVLGGGFGTRAGIQLEATKTSTTTLTAQGDYSAGSCYVGKPYTQRYRFSEIHMRDRDGAALLTGRLQLRTMTVNFSTTGGFRLEVTPAQRETFSYPYTAKILGSASATLGTNPVVTGKQRFPIVANAQGVRIDLVNDTPSPSFFQGAEWEAMYIQRARRA